MGFESLLGNQSQSWFSALARRQQLPEESPVALRPVPESYGGSWLTVSSKVSKELGSHNLRLLLHQPMACLQLHELVRALHVR